MHTVSSHLTVHSEPAHQPLTHSKQNQWPILHLPIMTAAQCVWTVLDSFFFCEFKESLCCRAEKSQQPGMNLQLDILFFKDCPFSKPGISLNVVKESLRLAFPTDEHHLQAPQTWELLLK